MTLALFLIAACAYVPPIDSANPDYPDTAGLSGTVLVSLTEGVPGRGHVLVYDLLNPPPPSGLGSPVDLATIAPSEFEGAAGGVTSAPWAVAGLGLGSYLVTALIDNDENFSPFFDFAAGATCGDTVGAYLTDLTTQAPAPVVIDSLPAQIDGLVVTAAKTLSTERPAFDVEGFTLGAPAPFGTSAATLDRSVTDTPQLVNLQSRAVNHPLLTLNGPEAEACASSFLVRLLDLDQDGEVDPHSNPSYAALGLKSAYPKVYLILAADLQGNPVDPAAGRYVSEAVVATDIFMAPYGEYVAGDSFLSPTLPAVFLPAALHIAADGTETVVQGPDMPAGLWATVVVQDTGQIWVVPNDLGDVALAEQYGWDTEGFASQGPAGLIPIQ